MVSNQKLFKAFVASATLLGLGSLGGCTIDQANAASSSGVTLKGVANDSVAPATATAIVPPVRTVETALIEKIESDDLADKAGTYLLGNEKIGENNYYFLAIVEDAPSEHGVLKGDGSVEALPCRTTIIEAKKAFEVTASGNIIVDVTKGAGENAEYIREPSGVVKSESRLDCQAPA